MFMSDAEDASLPTVALDVPPDRDHLTAKTMKAFDHVFQHYVNEYEWFMKADDGKENVRKFGMYENITRY